MTSSQTHDSTRSSSVVESTVMASKDAEKAPKDEAPAAATSGANVPPGDEQEYPPLRKVLTIMAALFLAIFLMALDRTIVSTAIPALSDEFQSFNDIGWYGSAYLLTSCAFMPLFGRVYTFYNPKWVFLILIGLFEIGSAICGAAPNSIAFIFGRAIAGLGTAGIFSGALTIMLYVVPLHKRPKYIGSIGGVMLVASVLGPILGGAFTTNVTWRWCFYINLPIGAVTIVVLAFVLDLPIKDKKIPSFKQQIRQLDPIGTALFLPSIICLLLALQWGGTTYPWNSGRIIALFVVFGVLLIAFGIVQRWKAETATLPGRIVGKRSIISAAIYSFSSGAVLQSMIYYLPVWFQGVQGVTPLESGIRTIPLVLALVLASISTGILVGKIGYYAPFMILGSILMPIAVGLFTRFTPTTPQPYWIGVQVILGWGIGTGMQQANMAAQTVLDRKDVPTGVAYIMFMMTLGGTIWISLSNVILTNHIVSALSGLPNFNSSILVNTGATTLRGAIPSQYLPQAILAYNNGIVLAFYAALAAALLSFFGSTTIEWRSVKKGKQQPKPAAEGTKDASDKV